MANGKKVAVGGGGAAGLAAAWTLRRRGIDVTLLEASGRVGGRMAGETIAGRFHISTGAQILSEMDRTALAMCRELGVEIPGSGRR